MIEILVEINKTMIVEENTSELEKERMKHAERMREIDLRQSTVALEKMKIQLEMKKLELQGVQQCVQLQSVQQSPQLNTQITKQRSKVGESKAVLQFDLQGKLIKKFNSIKEAAKETSSDSRSISAVCCRKRKSHNNFTWKHADLQ